MSVETQDILELVRRRRVYRVWSCGPRALSELLDELARERCIGTVIDDKLDRYAALTPELIEAVCGTNWQKPVLHLAAGGRR